MLMVVLRVAGEGGARVPRGSYVVRMDQPYRNFIQTLFEIQEYPENAPPSYDDTAWTLGLMYGVRTIEVRDKSVLNAAMEQVVADLPNSYTETKALRRRFEQAGSPRIGLVYTWRYTQDTGWLRFTLDTLGVPMSSSTKTGCEGVRWPMISMCSFSALRALRGGATARPSWKG